MGFKPTHGQWHTEGVSGQNLPLAIISFIESRYSYNVLFVHLLVVLGARDVKFVFFPNSNFVFKIRILFELRSGPK